MTVHSRLPILLVGALIGIIGLIFIPLWQQLTSAREELAFVEASRTRERQPTQQHESLERLQSQRAALRQLFIKAEDGVAFLEGLDRAADQAGVTLEVSFPREPQPAQRQHLPLTLTIRGPYPKTVSFVAALTSHGPLLSPSRLNLQADAEQLVATVELQTLWE